jgi:hypothetical protein
MRALAPEGAVSQSGLRLDDRVVEVVGLRQWTLQMLQDSLAAHGDSLQSHACAVTLRYELGFPEAAVSTYILDGSRHTVVSLVEPQDSARVRHRDLPLDTTYRAEWAGPVRVIREQPALFHLAINGYDPRGASVLSEEWRARLAGDTAVVHAVWGFLDERRGEDDFEAATTALASDRSLYDRMIAAAILANFTERDTALQILIETLREREGAAKAIASSVISALAAREPRNVDWGPAAGSIHALLNGTGLFHLPETLQWLPRMGAGPRWSSAFLAGGGEMVLAYLAAEHPPTRQAAQRFLVVMRGSDLGEEVGPWREWIASLPRDGDASER